MQNQANAAKSRLSWEQPPELPDDPSETGWSTTVPVPVVPARPEPTEYYVLVVASPQAMELEEKLNATARDGWSLFQMIRQGGQLLLVFWRPLHNRR